METKTGEPAQPDPLAHWRGKTIELTEPERVATGNDLAKIAKYQEQILNRAASWVLDRIGVPASARSGNVPIQVKIEDGNLKAITILDAKEAPPQSPKSADKPPIQLKGVKPRGKPPAKAAT